MDAKTLADQQAFFERARSTFITHHLGLQERKDMKIIILNGINGIHLPRHQCPIPYGREELLECDQADLMKRFLDNNNDLKEFCEEENEEFDDIVKIWNMPEAEQQIYFRESGYSWELLMVWYLRIHLWQVCLHEQQEAIKALLHERYNINVVVS